jgi:hypothetical protein
MSDKTLDFIGGIPISIFTNDEPISNEVIRSLSDRKIQYTHIPGKVIEIKDMEDPYVFFNAHIEQEITPIKKGEKLNTLHVTLRTKDKNNAISPDFYAGKLLNKAVEEFKSKGVDIQVVVGDWTSETELLADNWKQFMKHRFEDQKTPEEAAFSTWTGQHVKGLGFNKVYVQQDENANVLAYFYKERDKRSERSSPSYKTRSYTDD